MVSFNASSLELAHVIIHIRKDKKMEISLFFKEHDIEILPLSETWLKVSLSLIFRIILCRALIDQEG